MGACAEMFREFVFLTSFIYPYQVHCVMIADGRSLQAERISAVLNHGHMFPSHVDWYPQSMGNVRGK